MSENHTVELPFSEKYDRGHARQYYRKHHDGFARRLSHWREEQLARKALHLAGDPEAVLDLPCGAGRFWPLLAEASGRRILAADNSEAMLETALAVQPDTIVRRVQAFRTSAFDIDLESGAVDSIFCFRLLHHVSESAHRLAMLREFHRVTRGTLIFSLWVDGNIKAWRRRRLERRRAGRPGQNQNRFIVSREQIGREIVQAGFTLVAKLDFLPGYAMWRTYVVRKVT